MPSSVTPRYLGKGSFFTGDLELYPSLYAAEMDSSDCILGEVGTKSPRREIVLRLLQILCECGFEFV